MLILMVLLIFCRLTYVTNENAGSALFSSAQIHLNCWTKDNIAKLKARKSYEELIPAPVDPQSVNTEFLKNILKYFTNILYTVQKFAEPHNVDILKEALYDTIGAHLHHEILPSVRFAYYAGYIPHSSAREIEDYYEHIKVILNTQGVGWRHPSRIPRWSNLTVVKIVIGNGRYLNPCANLVFKRDINNCIHLPSPQLDDHSQPSAIALPFRRRGLMRLMSPNSENILLKYYISASRCILNNSPAQCRHTDFVTFNNELWHWMKRDVAPHLVEQKLYTAFGGVLRVAAAVQAYGKGLSRRNLFEYRPLDDAMWRPWKVLTDTHVVVNADWSPALYIFVVILAAIAICVLQMSYYYMFGEINGCKCKIKPTKSLPKQVSYAMIDEHITAVQPQQSIVLHSTQRGIKRASKYRTPSISSTRTQKVYDLNENTEKLMEVILSANEESETVSETIKSDSEDDDSRQKSVTITKESRPRSPPKIETTVAQVTVEKNRSPRPESKVAKPMYSTTTLTHSEAAYHQDTQMSDSVWSVSSSSTSGKTVTSTSSKSRSRRSRSSRDLAWARHVISRQSRRIPNTQSSVTELDGQSFITPPSRR